MRTKRDLPATVEWRHTCPECGTEMTGTGTVVHRDDPPTWLVELWCPKEQEVFTIWTADLEDRVADHLGKP